MKMSSYLNLVIGLIIEHLHKAQIQKYVLLTSSICQLSQSAEFSSAYYIWQVKNIAMEILDFYDSHKLMTDDRIHAAMNKLP